LRIINENIIKMKIEIENLKAQMTGIELNIYQKADALIEFNKLLDYVNKLEQLTIPRVVGTCCDDKETALKNKIRLADIDRCAK
jgi:hypothetical protein